MSAKSPFKRRSLEDLDLNSDDGSRSDGGNNNKRVRNKTPSKGNSPGPTLIKYLTEVTCGAESLNQRMREILSLFANEKLDSEHVSAWKKMTSVVDELAQTIAAITPTPIAASAAATPYHTATTTPVGSPPPPACRFGSGSPPPPAASRLGPGSPPPDTVPNSSHAPPMAAAPTPTTPLSTHAASATPTSIKRSHEELPPLPTPKKRKLKITINTTDRASWTGPTKRRFSEVSDAVKADGIIKRIKKNHKEGVERSLTGDRKRGAADDFTRWREDVQAKKSRVQYFQDGDPPIEYMVFSDDEDEDDDESPNNASSKEEKEEGGEAEL
ncbi:hypothetical protein FN846DRAFT_931905 [Sphaerosporella brunnea]|uniref:Uncharacterized protein n=1 Tax=Sphaerosporella brunnea TaxID=1250544 RepID=A0A5J5F8D2_9PEZI|nr:hypothetical protein FN846DRAFT_931905 [Sphaerosporella brunnea]